LLHDHDREYGGDPGNSDQRGWMNAVSCAERYRRTHRAREGIRLLEYIEDIGLHEDFRLEHFRLEHFGLEPFGLEPFGLEPFGLEPFEWFPGAFTGGAPWLATRFGRERIDRIGFRQVNRLGFIHAYS
jgi:hypothetical protein